MRLTFWGAAEQVTGSMHLLEIDNYKILIDCGLDYEQDNYLNSNKLFPFQPNEIDLVILTHAHIDHSGNLPTLVNQGFEGQILCTSATADLTALLLSDAVNLALGKNKVNNNKGRKKPKLDRAPLYLHKDVSNTIDRFVTISFNKTFSINNSIQLTFIPVGHLLGAAAVILNVKDQGIDKTIAFSGDLGRKNYPILPDPSSLPPVDYLVCESTYGGRYHSTSQTLEERLVQEIHNACIKTPGRLIIPAFSVGRTQSLVFALNQIFSKHLLPPVKVFVDSPLAIHATEVYRKHHHLVSQEAKDFYKKMGDEFNFDHLSYINNVKDSKDVANYLEPCIIISSAGMLDGGRIQDHLYYNIQNIYCTILFIGYCSKGTLGHKLLRGDSVVRIKDRELMVYASIKQTDLLSGHADQNDLMTHVLNQPKEKLKQVFLVHGETDNMSKFADKISEAGYNVKIPSKGEIQVL